MVSNQAASTKKKYSTNSDHSNDVLDDSESGDNLANSLANFGLNLSFNLGTKAVPVTESNLEGTTYDKITEGTFECLAKFGYSKTSMDDIAKQAKCSRATLYRLFPNGKDAIVTELVKKAVSDIFVLLKEVAESADDLYDAISKTMAVATYHLNQNAALQKVIECDPDFILPFLVFENMDSVLITISKFGSEVFGKWLDEDISKVLIEWLARIVLTYFSSPKGQLKFNDENTISEFVDIFIRPGLSEMTKFQRIPEI